MKTIINKFLTEIPKQIELLEDEYSKITDPKVRKEKMGDLKSYEKRLIQGFTFLNSIKSRKTIDLIEKISNPSNKLLDQNKKRYLEALNKYRKKNNIKISPVTLKKTLTKIKQLPLIHTTKHLEIIKKNGIHPASSLWMTRIKSCANPMDIILGLDKAIFLTQGFSLSNFHTDFIKITNKLLNLPTTTVSNLDLFTFVLIKTKKKMPCAIETKKWISSLADYSKNIFRGQDFFEIKAEYALTFFKDLDEYHNFGKTHFYSNKIEKAPPKEYPFLGEIRIFRNISTSQILNHE